MIDPASRLALLLAEGEGQRLEFKQALSRLDREIVCVRELRGRHGSARRRRCRRGVGVDTSNRIRSELQAIARNCDPSVQIKVANPAPGVLEVVVAECAQKPYRCKDGFYLRQGATTQKLSTAEIRRLVLQAGDYHFDESVNQHFHYPQDFDQNRYRAPTCSRGNPHPGAPGRPARESRRRRYAVAEGISLRQGGACSSLGTHNAS